jgi:ubiquinol-cytochrome c reductase cytochrome c1 subunit
MNRFKAIALAGLAMVMLPLSAHAAVGQKAARDVNFSFEGAFGEFDRQQLQRGYKVYKEVCANCHGMKLVSFRNLAEGGIFTEEQVKALAATFTVKDGPGEDGEMFDRPGRPSDRFPSPFANEQAARVSNGGSYPPDLSLITKSRPGWYGTWNQFWNGIGGPEYVYSVLTGYQDAPAELAAEQPEGKYYNPYFGAGHWIGMGTPLADGLITYDDGASNTTDDMAKDVAAFLAFTADPNMESRKRIGFMVMIYLAVLTVLLYLVKRRVWADQH